MHASCSMALRLYVTLSRLRLIQPGSFNDSHAAMLHCIRPVYGCLLAQRIAAPQMGITFIVTALHLGICYLLIYQAQVQCCQHTPEQMQQQLLCITLSWTSCLESWQLKCDGAENTAGLYRGSCCHGGGFSQQCCADGGVCAGIQFGAAHMGPTHQGGSQGVLPSFCLRPWQRWP